MEKWHISKNGTPAICRATRRPCPLGGDDVHFNTEQEAFEHIADEGLRENSLLPTVEPILRQAKTMDDITHVIARRMALKSGTDNYMRRCISSVRLTKPPLNTEIGYHMIEERSKRLQDIRDIVGEGEPVGYYEVFHEFEKDGKMTKAYQTIEIRDNGAIVVHDSRRGIVVTAFLANRSRIETTMILANDIPSEEFLDKVERNQRLYFDSITPDNPDYRF